MPCATLALLLSITHLHMNTALVIGATGLVGKTLTTFLLNHSQFVAVKTFVRKASGLQHPKLKEHIVNFEEPAQWQHLLSGTHLFACMGTTMKQAGSKEAQYRVDFEYQFQAAAAALANGVTHLSLISSQGANSSSNIFYLRIKGQLEEAVKKLGFAHTSIVRPSLLVGDRDVKRRGEKWWAAILHFFNALGLFKKYMPITDVQVAKAMIAVALTPRVKDFVILEADELFLLSSGNGG